MTAPLYATIDEQGRLELPAELAEAWGLSAGGRLRIESMDGGLHLRPPVTTLRRVYVEITNQCNLNCATCMRNVWNVEAGFMTEATFARLLEGMAACSSKPDLFFGGYGEPLSHPGCLSMLERATSQGLRVSLITNGILLTPDVSEKLIDIGLDMLWVSLDGASEECYADVRLGKTLPVIIENLKRFREMQIQRTGLPNWTSRPRLGIAFVAMQRNIHDLPEVIQLGARFGAMEYSISNVLAHNQSLQQDKLYQRTMGLIDGRRFRNYTPLVHFPSIDVNPETIPVLAELLKSSNRLELSGSELGLNSDQCPFVERGSLSLRWDGKVSPCLPLLYTHTSYLDKRLRTSHEYFVGDLHASDLIEIWQDANYRALRERLQEFDYAPCVFCNSCEMADENQIDCFGNSHPACGGCLWAQGLIRCP